MKSAPLAVVVGLVLVACSSPEAVPAARVVIMSDTHVIGPQYTTAEESSPADNESIFLSNDRLRAARARINAMQPRPDAVIVLGDVVHAAHHSMELPWYDGNRNAFTEAKEIFDGFDMPVHVLMGNHDYETGCGDDNYPKALSEELFRRFFGAEPYYAVEYGGVRFHLMNGQQGVTWVEGGPDCDTDFASYGAEQLAWLDDSLADGKPSVVMSHYMGLLWARNENPGVAGQEDLDAVINAHDNVGMYLAGHTHRWLDHSGLFGYPHYVVGPSRYDDDNFWVLELDGGRVTVTDADKAIWSNSCAETFDYDDVPMLDPDAEETGTCVMGLE